MLLMGGTVKTTVHQIEYFWLAGSAHVDNRTWADVGVWVSKNERALNRRSQSEVAQEVVAQFPSLDEVVVRDYGGKSCKWRKS